MNETFLGLLGIALAAATFGVIGFMAGIDYQKRHQSTPIITDNKGNAYTFVEGVFHAHGGEPDSNSVDVKIITVTR